MALTGTIINVDPTKTMPIYAQVDQTTDQDKYTSPTIKIPDYSMALRHPPLAPNRQNTPIM